MGVYREIPFPKRRKVPKKKRRIVAAPPKRKGKRHKITKPVAKPVAFRPAEMADGFALIHKSDGTISLASIRSNAVMVDSLAKVFDVAGYRIARVRVVELT